MRRPRLGIAEFLKGYLDLETRDLVWSDSAVVPWFYRVKGVRTIIADDASLEVAPRQEASAAGRE